MLKLQPPGENIEDIEDGELRNAACIMRLGGRAGCRVSAPASVLEAGPRHGAVQSCCAGVLSRPVTAVSTPVASARGWGPRTQARHHHTDVSNDMQENVSNS